MQENENIPETPQAQAVEQEHDTEVQDRPRLKKPAFKEEFKEKGKEEDAKNKPPMSKDETMKFYEENLPFMRAQDEYEEIVYRFNERKVKNLELQVREVEAIGFLAQWKAQQDEAKRRHDAEQEMKEKWEKMTPEEREEYKKQAQANLKIMDMQAKGEVTYDGENRGQIISFITGEIYDNADFTVEEDGGFKFQAPTQAGTLVDLCIYPGQKLARAEDGNFMILA